MPWCGFVTKWGLACQKQVSQAVANNFIPLYLWDVITCPSPWYLLLAHKYSYIDPMQSQLRLSNMIYTPTTTPLTNVVHQIDISNINIWFRSFLPKCQNCSRYLPRRSRRLKRNDPAGSPIGKTLAEVECEDPFMHSYQTPYNTNGEPDYASWINQRPLPHPSRDTASLKMGPREVQMMDSAQRQDRAFNTIPRHQNGHVYESPKFGRRDSSPLD